LVAINRNFCYDKVKGKQLLSSNRKVEAIMILAEKITLLRKQNGWSQEDLAEQLKVSRQSVSKWESAASIPDLDKIIKLSSLFGVSTDYLLKDDLEEITFSSSDDPDEEAPHSVSLEESNLFLELTRTHAPKIASAVSVLILSPTCLILFPVLAEKNLFFSLSTSMATAIGMMILLLMVALGVFILLFNGMKLNRFEYLETDNISLEYGVSGIVEKKQREFEPTFQKSIAVGVLLCILGVIPTVFFASIGSELGTVISIDFFLFMAAWGVWLFIWSCSIHSSFQKLLQKGDYTPENKKVEKAFATFAGAYWCIVTAIYLAISFLSNRWDTSWIIWPIAGVFFAAVSIVVQSWIKRKQK
jgi:transcriptional regulator with XRE-family HTH domain